MRLTLTQALAAWDTDLIASRVASDNGNRTDLDDAITMLGYTRAELEAEIEADECNG